LEEQMGRRPLKKEALDLLVSRHIDIACVLDVGVLSGTAELLQAFPDKKHFLFEPVAEFADMIEQNYAGIDHELINVAVSDTDGEVVLSLERKVNEDISHSRILPGRVAEKEDRVVPMLSLDSWLRERAIEGPFLLKIDIDGEELSVVAGATEVLKHSSVVIIEATAETMAARLQAVQAHGFDLIDIVEPCYYDEALWQADLVLVRSDLKARAFQSIHDNFSIDRYDLYTS
jgi:FkbM family methyltransferase